MKKARIVGLVAICLTLAFQVILIVEPAQAVPEWHWKITRCRPQDPNNYSVRCGLPGSECSSVMNCTEFPYPGD
jgi:hypothetical protein